MSLQKSILQKKNQMVLRRNGAKQSVKRGKRKTKGGGNNGR